MPQGPARHSGGDLVMNWQAVSAVAEMQRRYRRNALDAVAGAEVRQALRDSAWRTSLPMHRVVDRQTNSSMCFGGARRTRKQIPRSW